MNLKDFKDFSFSIVNFLVIGDLYERCGVLGKRTYSKSVGTGVEVGLLHEPPLQNAIFVRQFYLTILSTMKPLQIPRFFQSNLEPTTHARKP